MLCEGYELYRSLSESGFDIPTEHSDVKEPGKKPGYRIGLGENNLPQMVDELDQVSMGRLWYHRDGNHNAFPVVKIQHSLLKVPIDDPLRKRINALKKSEQTQRIKILREAIDTRDIQLPERDQHTWDRLKEKVNKWVDIFSNTDETYLALPLMLQRFANPCLPTVDLLHHVSLLIIQRLEQGHLQDVHLAQKILLGTIDKKKPNEPAKAEVPIVFDIAEINHQLSVLDKRMRSFVERRLLASEEKEPDGICAFQGEPRVLCKKRPPSPKIGALGETKFFSKNKDTPCEFRYIKSLADCEDVSKSFPFGEQLATDIASGLKLITNPEKYKGKTWRMVANGKWEGSGKNKKEKKDLLLVYCEGQPVISNEAADIFGCDEKEKRNQFKNDAKAVCQALDGIMKHRPQSRLQLLLIGKADKGKSQVLMHITTTPQEMLDAAERWQLGVRDNLPLITLPFTPEEKSQMVVEGKPHPPYPDRVVRLLSSAWIRGGMDEVKLEGPTLRQVLDFMLRSPGKWETVAENLLDLLIQRIGSLLIGIAAAFHSKDEERITKFKQPMREAALRAVSLLGILLHAFGRMKEVYMNDTAFQLGRLLSLADTLHREYCVHVRKGSIPPQLIGNALMPAMADNPEDAIDRLRERMNIYQAWANTAVGEEYRLANWVLGQVGEICSVIKRPLPTMTDQKFRAELFLGYLARS